MFRHAKKSKAQGSLSGYDTQSVQHRTSILKENIERSISSSVSLTGPFVHAQPSEACPAARYARAGGHFVAYIGGRYLVECLRFICSSSLASSLLSGVHLLKLVNRRLQCRVHCKTRQDGGIFLPPRKQLRHGHSGITSTRSGPVRQDNRSLEHFSCCCGSEDSSKCHFCWRKMAFSLVA